MLKSNRRSAKVPRKRLRAIAERRIELNATTFVAELLKLRPSGATGAYAAKWDYLESEIMSKYCDDTTTPPQDRADAAIQKMLDSEISCRKLNIYGIQDFPNKNSILFRAAQLCSDILGDIHELYTEMGSHWGFTSGATVCRTRPYGDPYYKWSSTWALSVTDSAFPLAKIMIDSTPLWKAAQPKIVSGNTVFTVPKSSDIDRAACKEPGLNQAMQSCVGSYIRKRLKRWNIDLDDQSINRDRARKGSRSGRFCTIDLKSASDSISQRIVAELLPQQWVKLLDTLRSPCGLLPNGKIVHWEKHSTMGNGYTFELESLIFYALTRAAIDISRFNRRNAYYSRAAHVTVYGDDIVCPSHYYHDVTRTLNACGFTVNEKKSYHSGPFRESCGGHFWRGYDIKPFYIRKPIDSLTRIIWLLNSLRRWAADDDGWCDPSVYSLWLSIRRKFCPEEFLGGQNLSSVSEVVSPHSPRFSYNWVYPTKEIDGVKALLRWFQYQNEGRSLDAVRFSFDSRIFCETQKPDGSLAVDNHCIANLRAGQVLRVKRYKPTLVETAMFPQEAVT
jgi:hypothetical protein